MSKLITVLSFAAYLLTASHAHAQKQTRMQKDLDEKYGFRELRFETDTTALTDLVFVRKEKGTRLYTRRDESKKIGEAEADEIDYAFYNGQLLRVVAKVKGSANVLALSRILDEQYGKGTFLPSHPKAYYWASKRVMITYDENILTNTATLTTWSRVLEARKDLADAKVAKEAKERANGL